MPSELELAWAAGFFDGEGTSFDSDGPRIAVAQMHPEVIERFGSVLGYDRVPKLTADGTYRFTIRSQKAAQAMALLWPYLGSVKREQFVRVFGFDPTDQTRAW